MALCALIHYIDSNKGALTKLFQRRTSIQQCLIWSKFWFYRFRMRNCHTIQSNWYALDLTCLLVGRTWSSELWVYSIRLNEKREGLNTVLVLNLWSLCQIDPQPFNFVSKWSLLLSFGWNMLMWLTFFFFFNIKNI